MYGIFSNETPFGRFYGESLNTYVRSSLRRSRNVIDNHVQWQFVHNINGLVYIIEYVFLYLYLHCGIYGRNEVIVTSAPKAPSAQAELSSKYYILQRNSLRSFLWRILEHQIRSAFVPHYGVLAKSYNRTIDFFLNGFIRRRYFCSPSTRRQAF